MRLATIVYALDLDAGHRAETALEFRREDQLPSDDPVRCKPVITLANKALNRTPKVKLEDGLAATIEYFRRLA